MAIFNVLLLLLLVSPPAEAAERRILAFGDSLTAGYGLAPGEGFVPQLEKYLRAGGHEVTVHNAGVSGDTTAGARARLDWSLAERPDLVIMELGANDGLRGIDPVETRRNLAAMLEELQKREIPVLLAGMLAPPNMGGDYGQAFDGLYPELAGKFGVPLYPFFLDGVAAQPDLNQGDGIHPNAAGVAVIVQRIAPFVLQALAAE